MLTAAINEAVKTVISTDKAAYPVNAMGTSKAMMEKVIVAKSRTSHRQNKNLLHPIWQRYVFPRQRDPALDRANKSRIPDHDNRSEYDEVYHVSG